MPMKFAYFTDLHLPIPSRPSFGSLLNKRILGYQSWLRTRRKRHQLWPLDALAADMRAQDCSAVLLGGDIVNIALPAEFAAAKAWLDQAFDGLPTAMVPGNHDAYVKLPWDQGLGHFNAYMMGWQTLSAMATGPSKARTNAQDFPYVADVPAGQGICVICVNSSPPTAPTLATGALGRDQCARLERLLLQARTQGLYSILMLHHPITHGTVSRRKALDDAPALRAVIARAGVDLVLHGHTHFPCLNDIATPGAPAPVFGGGSASHAASKGRYKPARYAVIDLSKDTNAHWHTRIDVREIDLETRTVSSVETHVFQRAPTAAAA